MFVKTIKIKKIKNKKKKSLVIQVYQHIGIPEILQSLTFVSQDQGAENWSFECISYKKKGFKRFKGLFIVESALSLSS